MLGFIGLFTSTAVRKRTAVASATDISIGIAGENIEFRQDVEPVFPILIGFFGLLPPVQTDLAS
jgi:hypothetical protein